MTNQKTPWDLDVRVRERNLRKGVLDEKDIDKYLKELPDSASNAENVTIPQPAVGNPSSGEDRTVAKPVSTEDRSMARPPSSEFPRPPSGTPSTPGT
jgi:hypothetical protein